MASTVKDPSHDASTRASRQPRPPIYEESRAPPALGVVRNAGSRLSGGESDSAPPRPSGPGPHGIESPIPDRRRPLETMATTQHPHLDVVGGPQPDKTYALTRSPLVVGRDPRTAIVVDHPEVSRRHARLVQHEDGWVIEDLDSTNGTFLNQERVVEPRPLADGDVIGLSDTVLLTFRKASSMPGDSEETLDHERETRSSGGTGDHPASSTTTVSDDRVSAALSGGRPTVSPGPRPEPRGKLAWLWMGVAFLVLLTVAVTALLFILRYAGVISPSLSEWPTSPSSYGLRSHWGLVGCRAWGIIG